MYHMALIMCWLLLHEHYLSFLGHPIMYVWSINMLLILVYLLFVFIDKISSIWYPIRICATDNVLHALTLGLPGSRPFVNLLKFSDLL